MIQNIQKKTILIALLVILLFLATFFALFHKYEYEEIVTKQLKSEHTKSSSNTYVESEYADAVVRIQGTVEEGTLNCYYYCCEKKSDFEYKPTDDILVDKYYREGLVIDETIPVGALGPGWHGVGMEVVGDTPLKHDVKITLEGRKYGYQILLDILRIKQFHHN